MTTFTLTPTEARICRFVGNERFEDAQRNERDAGLGPSSRVLEPRFHIQGAMAEFAASQLLNLSWRPSVGQVNQPDVGGFIQVRSTDLPHGRLIVKPLAKHEKPGGIYVLMIAQPENRFLFVGGYYADVARRQPLVHGHGDPAHFVNQRDLHTYAEMLDIVRIYRK